MLPKKYILLVLGLAVVGGVIGLTWFGSPMDSSPTDLGGEPKGNDNASDLVGVNATELPPGVNVDGIVPPTITEGHLDALDTSRSYTLSVETSTKVDGETTTEITTYERGENSVLVTTTVDGEMVVQRYSNLDNGTVYVRQARDGEDQYRAIRGQTISASNHQVLAELLLGGNWMPESVDRNNETLDAVVTASNTQSVDSLKRVFDLTSIRSLDGRTVISDDGLVRSISVTVDGVRDGQNATSTHETTVSDSNQTIVPRPEWVTTAQEQAPTSWVGMNGDRRSIFVSHRGGQALDAGTTLDMYVEEGDTYRKHSTVLPSEFSEGETLFLAIEGDNLTVYENSAPDRPGDELVAESYYVELIPPGQDDPATEFEVRPSGR